MSRRQQLRPTPSGYKPSKRAWNELEQTPTHLAYSQPGTPGYRKFYGFAAQVFDAEAHHMVDLGYIDKMLYKAGFTTGAKGTKNYSEARQRIIEGLRKKGIDVGNVEANIAPLSKQQPKFNKTGIAHTFVHDAYNKIPEASDEFLRSLDEEHFTDYLVEKARQRKDYVVQAMEHKYNAMVKAHPELKSQSPEAVRQWIHDNKQEFGSLGDETLSVTRRNPDPVPGQPRGRVPVNPTVNQVFRSSNNSYLGALPVPDPASVGKLVNRNRVGSALGGVAGALADPDAVADALEGDFKGASRNIATGALTGAAVQGSTKALTSVAPAVGIKSQLLMSKATPVLAGAALFAEGRDGSATNRIVSKAAEFTPGLKPDPKTDIGKRAGDWIGQQATKIRDQLKHTFTPKPAQPNRQNCKVNRRGRKVCK